MPKVAHTREQRAKELLRKLTNGPSFSIGFPFSEALSVTDANREATESYRRWSETWVIGELCDLIPELRRAAKVVAV